jgi:hypothetical protein
VGVHGLAFLLGVGEEVEAERFVEFAVDELQI